MLIDGKKTANEIQKELEVKISEIKGRKPGLAFILVGENPASLSYVRAKKRACALVGIVSTVLELPQDVTEIDLLQKIDTFNRSSEIDGILVQLPLPSHINETLITSSINPAKDVDGFHPLNVGKMLLGDDSGFLPCTPHGIKELLLRHQIPVSGKHVVIVGRSNIVGKPLAAILMQKKEGCNATVTVAHSQTENLSKITLSADVLVAAVGKANCITKEMVKPGSTVIDVGINRVEGKLVGDVDFENVSKVAAHITPVPGGVGPMTIAMLLQNTFFSFLKLLTLLLLITSCQKKEISKDSCTHFDGWKMTMPYHVVLGEKLNPDEKAKVSQVIENTFLEVHNIFDNWNETSEISQINKAPKETLIPLSLPLQNIFAICNQIVTLSGGRFDPTIEPLISLWKNSKEPSAEKIKEISEALGWKHITIHNGILKKDSTETRLDLCALSKGLCIDWIIERIQALGHTDILVEWAGEIRAIGHHPENRDWTIQIDPGLKVENQSLAPLPLRNCALATSGNQNGHIIDPLTAMPVESSIASVTVMAPTCVLADALATTAMLFRSRKEAESFAQEVVDLYPDVSFWIISHRDEK